MTKTVNFYFFLVGLLTLGFTLHTVVSYTFSEVIKFEQSIRYSPVEIAGFFHDNALVKRLTGTKTEISVDDTELTKHVGHVMTHNHTYPLRCASLSPKDMLIASVMDLSEIRVVTYNRGKHCPKLCIANKGSSWPVAEDFQRFDLLTGNSYLITSNTGKFLDNRAIMTNDAWGIIAQDRGFKYACYK